MKYTVKNKDGELAYGSLEEVKTAYVLGLVEPEDEVLEEGGRLPRKAGAIPLLVTAKKVRGTRTHFDAIRGWIFGALVLGIIGFYLLVTGQLIFGGIVMVAVVSVCFRITMLAAKRKKT